MSSKGEPPSAESVNEITKSFQRVTIQQQQPEIPKNSQKVINYNINQKSPHPPQGPSPIYPQGPKSSTKQIPSHIPPPKPKSTQESFKWAEKSELYGGGGSNPSQPAARLNISKSTEVPKKPITAVAGSRSEKPKIEKSKSTEGLLTHEETSHHSWTCEICELDETNCNCDDYIFRPPEPRDPSTEPADDMNIDFYPADEDVPPGVLNPPGGEPWLCEICEQKQEDCHCDDYFDLDDNEPFYHPQQQQHQQQHQQHQKGRNHERSTSLTSRPPAAAHSAGTGTGKNICAFYLNGKCRFANQCRDLHPSFEWICPYFLRGNCKFGDNCNLGHINLTLK
jgi:hypothetical protein